MDSSKQAARALSTFFVWTAITILGASTLVNGQFLGGAAVVFVMSVLLAAGVIVTENVWKSSGEDKAEAEKVKRRGKVEKFMDTLNDEELNLLRERLITNVDGEMVSVDEMLHEIDRHEQR